MESKVLTFTQSMPYLIKATRLLRETFSEVLSKSLELHLEYKLTVMKSTFIVIYVIAACYR